MEFIVEDATFVTMAPAGRAESMLVRDGRIAAIGPAAAVRAAAEPGAAVVRLGGATVIPGLIDAHCHVLNIGYLAAGADCSHRRHRTSRRSRRGCARPRTGRRRGHG